MASLCSLEKEFKSKNFERYKEIYSTETYLYSSVAILVASAMFRQSMSQKRADTVVVKDTQSFTKVSGVEPVTSSHWARVVPPRRRGQGGRSIRLSVTRVWIVQVLGLEVFWRV